MAPRMSCLSSVASGASVFSIFAALLMLGYQVVLLQLRLGSRKLVVAVGTFWELLTQLRDPHVFCVHYPAGALGLTSVHTG